MGRVYLGLSRSGRRLAVKVVRPDIAADPGFRERFRREVEAARTVGGFWTAPIVDADPDAATPWVASDYIDAPSLGLLVDRRGALDERALRSMAAGLAEALEAIHGAGLVHRDLKPSNIMVTGDGPRVIDFGISKAAEGATTLTETGLVIGTPGFMSPEQASGARVGPASDIFSLGAVLAFAATGEGPFGAGSVPALLYRVVHDEPSLEGVPEGLRGVVAVCLEKEPGRRPSASELLDLLSGGAAPGGTGRGSPAYARPPSVPPMGPVAEVHEPQEAPSGVPDEVEVRAGTARRQGRGTTLGGWMTLIGFLSIFPGALVTEAFAGGGAVLTVLVLGMVVGMVGGGILKRQPPAERSVALTAEGLHCRVLRLEWSSPWEDVERITLRPLVTAATERQWVLSVVLRRGMTVPPGFADGLAKNKAGIPLVFADQQDHRAALRRLDDALRCFADGLYERHDALAALLGGHGGRGGAG
ncbi:serine/threonine protein kinase [Streptomyces sp. ISL-36]|nr:serine/threonine protein kinase [Streptomyces sp. ISL-36]